MWTNGFFYNSINRHFASQLYVRGWMRTYACMRPVPGNSSLSMCDDCVVFLRERNDDKDDAERLSPKYSRTIN